MPHAVHQPCYGFIFYWRERTKKDQKTEKCKGEGQFFCLHRLFMLVLWTFVRRTEARKSRCCLKSYLKGGWSEEVTQCQGKAVIVIFHDLIQFDIQQLDSCIPFQVVTMYWYVCLPLPFILGVLVLDTWICWQTLLQLKICYRFWFVFLILLTQSDPYLYCTAMYMKLFLAVKFLNCIVFQQSNKIFESEFWINANTQIFSISIFSAQVAFNFLWGSFSERK